MIFPFNIESQIIFVLVFFFKNIQIVHGVYNMMNPWCWNVADAERSSHLFNQPQSVLTNLPTLVYLHI